MKLPILPKTWCDVIKVMEDDVRTTEKTASLIASCIGVAQHPSTLRQEDIGTPMVCSTEQALASLAGVITERAAHQHLFEPATAELAQQIQEAANVDLRSYAQTFKIDILEIDNIVFTPQSMDFRVTVKNMTDTKTFWFSLAQQRVAP